MYVTGGSQKAKSLGVREWALYEKAVILVVDFETGKLIEKVEYKTPDKYRPDLGDSSVLFKSASFGADALHVCTQTEIISYSLPDLNITRHISLPCFNDVHHVLPTIAGTLLVANTGLDCVVELSPDGETLNDWSTCNQATWSRFSKEIDYRKVLTTKPHRSHPNFLFQLNSDFWVTRFEQKDAICLTSAQKRIDISIERPHDGFVFQGQVFFTTVDGHIVVADSTTHDIIRTINLSNARDVRKVLGWCRGLQVLDDNQLLVGFSRIRPTKIHSNLLWMRRQLGQAGVGSSSPTRVALFDIEKNSFTTEYNLERYGLNTVFSVYVEPLV